MEIDIYDPEFMRDPYPGWAYLRENAPVYREPRNGAIVLTRFDDVYNALMDHGTYSSTVELSPPFFPEVDTRLFVYTDPPEQSALRGLVSRAWTPRATELLWPRIERLVERIVNAIPADEEFNVSQWARMLPMRALAEMLGLAAEDHERVAGWAAATLAFPRPGAIGLEEVARLAGVEVHELEDNFRSGFQDMREYFEQFLQEFHDDADNPEVAGFCRAVVRSVERDPENLDRILRRVMAPLLAGGTETTTNMATNLVDVLLDRPDLYGKIRQDRSLVDPAIEESLRYASTVKVMARYLTEDVEVRGTPIPKGTQVILFYGSANRDEAEFPHADEFDLDRDLKQHFAFGHGVHACIGAPLARLEFRAWVNCLLDRFSSIERGATPPERIESFVYYGFSVLPVVGRC